MNKNPFMRLAVVAAVTGIVGYVVGIIGVIGYLRYTTVLVVLLLVWYFSSSRPQMGIVGSVAAVSAAISGTAALVSVLRDAHVLWFKGDFRLLETQVPVEFVMIVACLTMASMMIVAVEISPGDRKT